MNKFLSLTAVFILTSCTNIFNNGIAFEIENKTNEPISEIKLYTSEFKDTFNLNYLKPDKKINDLLSMKNNKIDGSYIIEFKNKKNETIKKSFGYYTNGNPIESKIYIKIKADTIITKFENN